MGCGRHPEFHVRCGGRVRWREMEYISKICERHAAKVESEGDRSPMFFFSGVFSFQRIDTARPELRDRVRFKTVSRKDARTQRRSRTEDRYIPRDIRLYCLCPIRALVLDLLSHCQRIGADWPDM